MINSCTEVVAVTLLELQNGLHYTGVIKFTKSVKISFWQKIVDEKQFYCYSSIHAMPIHILKEAVQFHIFIGLGGLDEQCEEVVEDEVFVYLLALVRKAILVYLTGQACGKPTKRRFLCILEIPRDRMLQEVKKKFVLH